MGERKALTFSIGASLSQGFQTALGGAKRHLGELTAEIKHLSKERGLMDRALKDTAALEKAGHSVDDYRNRLGRLDTQLATTRHRQEQLRNRLAAKQGAAQDLAALRGTALAGAGVAYGLGRMGLAASGFEHELRLLGNTGGLSLVQLGQIHRQLNQIGKDTNQTPGELLVGLKTLVGKGLDPGRSVASLGAIGKAATSATVDVDDLAKTSFSLIDALNIAPEALPNALDMLAEAGKQGSFELKDMAKHFPVLTAGARSLGLSGKEGVATLAAMAQIAMKGAGSQEEAANNLQNFITKATSRETVKNFEKMGVNLEAVLKTAAKAGKNPLETLLALVEKLTQGNKFRMGELFGDMQVLNFLNPMLANLKEYERIKARTFGASGVVDRDFANMMGTTDEKLKKAKVSLGEFAVNVGNTLLPALNAVLGPLPGLVDTLGGIAEKSPIAADGVKGLALGIGGVATAIGLVRGAVWALNSALLANPLTAMFVGGAVLATGFLGWAKRDLAKNGRDSWATPLPGAALGSPGTPLAAGHRAALPLTGSHTTTISAPITVHAAPGREREAGEAVARALRKFEQDARARSRSALHDGTYGR